MELEAIFVYSPKTFDEFATNVAQSLAFVSSLRESGHRLDSASHEGNLSLSNFYHS